MPLLGVLLLAPAAPGGAQPRAEGIARASDQTYRRPLGNDPAAIDPARVSDIYGLSVSEQIFDGLVQFDQTLTVMPSLAQFWKASRDGLTWTFMLRKNVKFHHGRELTSDDVVFSLTRLLDPRTASGGADFFVNIKGAREFREGRAKSVAGIAALDRYTVEIALVESFAPFVSLLALGHAKIVPRDIVEARGDAFGAQPVGSGPFRFVQWDHGKEIVLAGNPDYFDGPPALSRLVYRIFSGDSTAAMFKQFEQGALEDAPVPTGQRLGSGDPRFQYIRRTTYSARFYGFNTRVKPLDDRRVRQAIVHAVDRDTILHEVFLDRFHPARGIIPPGTPGFDPSLQGFAYDPARARDLLRQAGYSAARPLPVIPAWSTARSETVVREHEMMKRALAAVGVSLDVRYQQDWPSFLRLLGEGRAPMFLYAWHADAPDPDNFLFKLFHSRGPRNFFGYANPAFDDLIRRARSEPDPTRRVELYRRAERMVLDDAVILPVWHYVYEHVFQPYVRSVQVNGLGDPYIPMRKIWLDRR